MIRIKKCKSNSKLNLFSKNQKLFFLEYLKNAKWTVIWPQKVNKICWFLSEHLSSLINKQNKSLILTTLHGLIIWGQFYNDIYNLGQIYKCVLKHKNNDLTQTIVCYSKIIVFVSAQEKGAKEQWDEL